MMTSTERKSLQIAQAASAGKNLQDRYGLRYTVCKTCDGAGLLPPLFTGDGWGIECSTCHGKGVVSIAQPSAGKFGALSESLKGGYHNERKSAS